MKQTQELITEINVAIDRLENIYKDNTDIDMKMWVDDLTTDQLKELFRLFIEEHGYNSSYAETSSLMSGKEGFYFCHFNLRPEHKGWEIQLRTQDYEIYY